VKNPQKPKKLIIRVRLGKTKHTRSTLGNPTSQLWKSHCCNGSKGLLLPWVGVCSRHEKRRQQRGDPSRGAAQSTPRAGNAAQSPAFPLMGAKAKAGSPSALHVGRAAQDQEDQKEMPCSVFIAASGALLPITVEGMPTSVKAQGKLPSCFSKVTCKNHLTDYSFRRDGSTQNVILTVAIHHGQN